MADVRLSDKPVVSKLNDDDFVVVVTKEGNVRKMRKTDMTKSVSGSIKVYDAGTDPVDISKLPWSTYNEGDLIVVIGDVIV